MKRTYNHKANRSSRATLINRTTAYLSIKRKINKRVNCKHTSTSTCTRKHAPCLAMIGEDFRQVLFFQRLRVQRAGRMGPLHRPQKPPAGMVWHSRSQNTSKCDTKPIERDGWGEGMRGKQSTK